MHPEQTSDGIYDEVVVKIGMEWLAQYARFLRRSPELVEGLAERPEDFEMIPIPKVLLNRLAVPGIVDSGNLGDIDPEILQFLNLDLGAISRKAAIAARDAAFERIREFAAAIAGGDATRATALFSPQFINPDGMNAAEIHQTLQRLFESTYNRRFEVNDIREVRTSEQDLVARLDASWSAAESAGSADSLAEKVCLEFILELNTDGEWEISAVRSV
jgi:hypothetical protein